MWTTHQRLFNRQFPLTYIFKPYTPDTLAPMHSKELRTYPGSKWLMSAGAEHWVMETIKWICAYFAEPTESSQARNRIARAVRRRAPCVSQGGVAITAASARRGTGAVRLLSMVLIFCHHRPFRSYFTVAAKWWLESCAGGGYLTTKWLSVRSAGGQSEVAFRDWICSYIGELWNGPSRSWEWKPIYFVSMPKGASMIYKNHILKFDL